MAKLQPGSTSTERGRMISMTVVDTGQTQHLFIPKDLPLGIGLSGVAIAGHFDAIPYFDAYDSIR